MVMPGGPSWFSAEAAWPCAKTMSTTTKPAQPQPRRHPSGSLGIMPQPPKRISRSRHGAYLRRGGLDKSHIAAAADPQRKPRATLKRPLLLAAGQAEHSRQAQAE